MSNYIRFILFVITIMLTWNWYWSIFFFRIYSGIHVPSNSVFGHSRKNNRTTRWELNVRIWPWYKPSDIATQHWHSRPLWYSCEDRINSCTVHLGDVDTCGSDWRLSLLWCGYREDCGRGDDLRRRVFLHHRSRRILYCISSERVWPQGRCDRWRCSSLPR